MALEPSQWSVESPTRLFAGVSVGRRSGRLKTAIVRCRGEGLGLRVLSAEALTVPPPSRDEPLLADAAANTLAALARHAEIPLAAIDVLGLHGVDPADDGTSSPAASPIGTPSLAASSFGTPSLAARLAERTGVTVVSGFPLRDMAAGGAGEPLSPLPDWFLFRSTKLSRLLVHLGTRLRATFLPRGAPPERILCHDAGPCCDFLDGLIADLSDGKRAYDPFGRFAVQGRASEELIAKWKSHPYLLRPAPKFLSGHEFGDEFRKATIAFARDQKISGRDVLCSANIFVVRCLEESLERRRPGAADPDEVWVSGGGSWNGFLWKRLRDAFAPIPVRRTDDAGVPSEARAAVHAALLAFAAMDHLPANLPRLTGAAKPAVLGQITPGSPENYDRFVCNLVDRFDLEQDRAA